MGASSYYPNYSSIWWVGGTKLAPSLIWIESLTVNDYTLILGSPKSLSSIKWSSFKERFYSPNLILAKSV